MAFLIFQLQLGAKIAHRLRNLAREINLGLPIRFHRYRSHKMRSALCSVWVENGNRLIAVAFNLNPNRGIPVKPVPITDTRG